jgi:predicted hotdog family 3-hydroxylacyl-ACP dehydratase
MYSIEEMIPHRGTMKLVQEIVEVGGDRCVTASNVLPAWPTYENGSVSPIILIELVAQTAGVSIGWQEYHSNRPSGNGGWLVGIRRADFYCDRIPENTRILVTIEENRREESYAVIKGRARIGQELIGDMELQVFRPR